MKTLSGKIIRRFAKIIQRFRVHYYSLLSSDVCIQGTIKKSQPLLIVGKGNIIINGTATLGYFPSPFYFSSYAHFDLRQNSPRIAIGNGVVINNNSTLIADGATILIGNDSLIGFNFTAMTSDAHGLKPEKRKLTDYPRQDVTIGNNVFIGNNVTILKGVTVGNNTVIGSGSVVVANIPENVIAAGVPCRVIRAL